MYVRGDVEQYGCSFASCPFWSQGMVRLSGHTCVCSHMRSSSYVPRVNDDDDDGIMFMQKMPMYKIFAADSRSPRDGRHLEVVGYYDPIPEKDGNKHLGLNIERIRYWLSVGAQPSTTVGRLLGQAGVIPRAPVGLHHGAVKNPDKFARKTATKGDEEKSPEQDEGKE